MADRKVGDYPSIMAETMSKIVINQLQGSGSTPNIQVFKHM